MPERVECPPARADDPPASLAPIRRRTADGAEYWSARELATLLGYRSYGAFQPVLARAQRACALSGQRVADHFVPSPAPQPPDKNTPCLDMNLSRLGCYLAAQNANPAKPPVARAQTYMALRTRRQELTAGSAEGVTSDIGEDALRTAAQVFLAAQVAQKLQRDGITDPVQEQCIRREMAADLQRRFGQDGASGEPRPGLLPGLGAAALPVS